MHRAIQKRLEDWKNDQERLVLLVRGARQVGKTYSIRCLGESFRHFLEINFEEQEAARTFFSGDLAVNDICEKLSAYRGIPIVPSETLLFFDEVQACPGCIRALRFFHEKMPGLHVVAAGSLLEFALCEIPSFGVGRIQSLYMFPLSFEEFLRCEGSGGVWDYASAIDDISPIDAAFHEKLLDKMRTYMMIGGMPDVVDLYCRHRDLRRCQERIGALLTTFYDDFSKYSARIDPLILRDTFRSVSSQAGGKFKYSSVAADLPGRQSKAALDLLARAGLVHRVWHSHSRGVPLGAEEKHKRFKVIPMDIGIHQRMLGLELSDLLVADYSSLVHRGHLAEIFAGLQILTAMDPTMEPELFYWHREAGDSNAEVDYVITKQQHIIPIEVKSGLRGTMQSMRIFLKERNIPCGVRLSQENLSRHADILNLPLYLSALLMQDRCIDCFLS
ncbi:MAG: AAA family ATPase [Chitinivibrionales bacterium]|nr:AAA family ATPase [Chitinivibrionales bacterium]